jgi:AraC-like DNA-binding protein
MICCPRESTRPHSGPPVYKWSTDQVDSKDRFDYWREVRARGLFGVTAELEPEQRPQFFGEFSLQKFDGAGLIELRASPYQVERSTADIQDAPGRSLCIYQQLGGGGWFGVNGSGDFTIQHGRFATSHTDLPYNTAPLAADGYHLRILKIPVGDLPPLKAGVGDLVPKPVHEDASLAPLLQSCFSDLTAGDSDPAMTTPLVQALAQFALIDRGVVKPASRAALAAIRVGHLSLARRLIARHLSDAGLSPAFVADLLGISLRHLHGLFEATGASFSRAVTAQRMKESRRLLIEAPERPVSQIALACGFESLATFYRAFHTTHGMAPGDFRAQRRAGEAGPADLLYLKAK